MDHRLSSLLTAAFIVCSGLASAANYSSSSQVAALVDNEPDSLPLQADRIFENRKFVNFFSVFTKEPEDSADSHRVPDTQQPGYNFPIYRIRRHQDSSGLIKLDGIIYLRGDASITALPQIYRFFSSAGGKSRLGTQYAVNIRFELAAPNIKDAVEIRWLNKSELDSYASENGRGEIYDDNKMIVGFTQLGSRLVRINPVYADVRSMKLAFSNWPIDKRQLRDTIKHTRGVFAHEIVHAMGLSHMSNKTRSMASYAFGRSINGLDAQAICLLVTNGDKKLCPD